jgi:poly(beta-D-mannuronate) lyase
LPNQTAIVSNSPCRNAIGLLFMVLAAIEPAWAAGEAMPAGDCPVDPPLAQVVAGAIYSDPKGSIVDPEKLHQHAQEILPLRKFVTDASERADSSDRAQQECALQMMRDWAMSRAMATPPADFGGSRELERFTIALNVIALKLRADGLDVEPLRDWLGTLNHEVTAKFAPSSSVGNLHVWSGVAAASYALLYKDEQSRSYENTVWKYGISAIRPDGFVDRELQRGARALLYHVYNLSALVTLRAFRGALGEADTPPERDALRRMTDRVGAALCDPSTIAAASGVGTQDPPPAIEFAPIVAFAGDRASPHLLDCAPSNIPNTDPILGGQFGKTAAILSRLKDSPRAR